MVADVGVGLGTFQYAGRCVGAPIDEALKVLCDARLRT
jgi:hypothetical protein